jgi:hypothetical protein
LLSHLRLTVGGKVFSVLSRIGPAGLDYSGRPNKYAHHVVLEDKERSEGGPAWLLSDPLFMEASWSGEPREIPVGRVPRQGDRQPGVARAWQSLTGDAGWSGVLAELFLLDPRRPVFLLFQPGMDLLPLFVEALALLPSSRRWDVDFSTYYSQLPQGVSCIWRGVLTGSDEARSAERLPNALVLDLSHPIGRAEGGSLVHLARTGETGEAPDRSLLVAPMGEAGQRAMGTAPKPSVPIAPDASHPAPAGSRASAPPRVLAPELARLVAAREGAVPTRRLRTRPWVPVAFLTAACGIALVAIALVFRAGGLAQLLGLNSELSQEIARNREIASAAVREAENAERRDKPVAAQAVTDAATDTTKSLAQSKPNNPPPVAPKVEAEKPHDATPPPANSTPANPLESTPAVTYLAIPEMMKSMMGGSESNAVYLRDFSKEVDVEPKFLNIDSNALQISDATDGVITLSRKSSSKSFGNKPVAQFTTREAKLEFQWLDKNTTDVNGAIRDMVLKYPAKDREGALYVLLRKPQTDGKPISLTSGGHSKEWTNEVLKGTKWKCGIREWRIASSSADTSGLKAIFGGKEKRPATKIEKSLFAGDHIAGRAWITLEIKGQNIDIRFEYENERMQILRPPQRRIYLIARTDNLNQLRSELRDRAKDLADVDAAINHLNQAKEAEDYLARGALNMIVSVELEDHTILDIAKFGDYAEKAQ